jgi:pimeloyl-ACP methyl ester carboxylesterase
MTLSALQLTTIASDWHDINTVVDHIRTLRNVSKVSLVAWSLGGPRAGDYAAQHADNVNRMVLFAPAYNRASPGISLHTASRTAGSYCPSQATWRSQLAMNSARDCVLKTAPGRTTC